MKALDISNLTVRYPGYGHSAIEEVSFEVEENTITAIIGPNGSGKTTLIKAILGLIDYQGSIKVFGKPIDKNYKEIGFVPQRFSFDPTFPITVEEFVSLALLDKKNQQAKNAVKTALGYVKAENLLKRKLSSLSGGQLQRALLARALVREPKLLLLDEPEAGVDAGGEQTFYDLIEGLVEDKKLTVLIASHELDVVYAYAKEVICINRQILCQGKPDLVFNQETFEKLYGRGLKFYGHNHHNPDKKE